MNSYIYQLGRNDMRSSAPSPSIYSRTPSNESIPTSAKAPSTSQRQTTPSLSGSNSTTRSLAKSLKEWKDDTKKGFRVLSVAAPWYASYPEPAFKQERKRSEAWFPDLAGCC